MIVKEKQKWSEKPRFTGGSTFLLITPEMKEHLGIQSGEKDFVWELLPDNGKHGKFIAFWKKQ